MLGSGNRRLLIILVVLIAAASVVVLRLVDLQVIRTREIRREHEKVYGGEERLEPVRGPIVDRNGGVLAITTYEYRVTAAPNQILNPRETASILSSLLVTRTYSILPSLDPPLVDGDDPVLYSVVAPRVSAEVAQAIEDLDLVGISVEPVQRRLYPQGQLLSHVLGWVDLDMKGNSGIEGYYDRELRGEAAIVRQFPFLFGQWETARPHPGATVYLTVDRTVQLVTEQVLADALRRYNAPSGSIIVMDPRTYEILAMASLPAFDPNTFYDEDPKRLVNPCVSEWFEPGSIHKVLTMAAAVDAGVVTPEDTYEDYGVLEVGGVPIYNWDRGAHGTTDMVTLLAKSLNVGAATLAQWMGRSTFYRYMEAFGLGQYTGVDLEAEAVGRLKRPGDDLWTEADLGTNAFGQGVAVTPLQELVAIAAVANGGVIMQPHIVSEIRDGDQIRQFQPNVVGRPISEATADTLSWMMAQAVAREVPEAAVPGYAIAGKTGTGQIVEGGVYHPTDVIGTFVGFLPADDPQVIVLIKIDRPQVPLYERWGSMTAAPTFAELAQQLVVLLDIPPDAERAHDWLARSQ